MARTDATPRKLPAGAAEPPKSALGVTLERGVLVGRYIVLGWLGEGGMGTVAAAYDPELDRKVALKLVRADPGGEDAARLLREARALAKFSHPNVVAVHDVGESDTDVYLAMELVDGVTLGEWIREKRPWREIVRVFVAAGRGLAAAHVAGLVHRDVKPSNILLGVDGRVRVVDFGLARTTRSLQAAGVPGPRLGPVDVVVTAAEWIGTPAYMAPEQFAGGTVDARADQWAFCVALHEALWGVRPFLGNDDEQIRRAVLRGVPVATQDGAVPAALRRIVMRGLSVDPTQRFPDMDALLAALEASRRRRPLQVLAIATALVLAGTAGAAVWSWRTADDPDRARVDAIASAARDAAAKAYFVYPPPDDPQYATAYRRVLELEHEGYAEALAQAELLRHELADTLSRLGDRYWDLEGGRGFAIDYYAQALLFAPDDAHARSRATLTVGEIAALRERADDAAFSAAELDAAEVLVILADPEDERRDAALQHHRARARRARTLEREAELDRMLGGVAPTPIPASATSASEAAPRAEAPTTPMPKADKPAATAPSESVATLVDRARAAWRGGNARDAESLLHRALAIDSGHVAALALLSELHFDRGAYSKAVDFGQRAVARAPKRADLRIQLGDALFKVLRYRDARTQYEQAQALGHKAASKRIAQVDAKLGGSPAPGGSP